jgi:hypothetical protein
MALLFLVFPCRVYKWPVNPIFNPKPSREAPHATSQYYNLVLPSTERCLFVVVPQGRVSKSNPRASYIFLVTG